MDELIRWAETDPISRRYEVTFEGDRERQFRVRVWLKEDEPSEGHGRSLNFAAVRALIAWDERQVAP